MTTAAYRLIAHLPQGVVISTVLSVDGRSRRDCDRNVCTLVADLYPDATAITVVAHVPPAKSAYHAQALATSTLVDLYDGDEVHA